MKEKEKDILGDTQYKEQQLKNFYDTFMGGAHGIQPSHSKEEGASLPGIERYEKPDMTESQREFLKEFQEYCRIIDFGGNASVIPDISKCRVPYRDELNEDQLRAVTWSKGPLLVIAGAGTGKTRTICYRTAYLIEQGVSPGEILLLTFTRKAAQEMTDRTSMLIQDAKAAGKVHGGTFHGFANYILRRYADMIGLDRNYTILDNVDAQDVISLIRDEMKLTRKKQSPVPKSSVIITVLSRARSCERSISEVILREYEYLEPYQGDIELIGRVFREFKQAHRQMDYDDLLEVLHDMLKQNSLFRKKIQQKYRFIIVDEFQDTNLVQGRLVKLLAGEDPQVMVVGDDAQSIYSFRGSRHENILRFPKVFPSCGIVKIQQNYRSRKGILTYTNSVIDSMEFGYKKALVTSDAGEGKPEVRRFFYQQDEAGWICGRIEELREQGIPLEQIAVLFRSQYLSDYLQAELLKRRIPFTVYGGLKFVERRHVKDMLAYLRIALNTLDAAAWNRILRLLPDIGSVRASMVIQTVMQNGGVFNASSFRGYSFSSRLGELEKILEVLRDDRKSLHDRIMELKRYYVPLMKIHCGDYTRRIPDLDVLAVLGETGDSLEEFLSNLALDPPGSTFQDPRYGEEETREHVVLSTVHSAKGLEWRHVFVLALLDGVFPDMRSIGDLEELEEERRLFYVACTRAKEGLYLSFPSYIQSYNNYFSLPSRFLAENREEHFRFFIGDREQRVTYI